MKIKKSLGEASFDVSNTLLLIGISLATLYPFLYVLLASVSNPSELVQYRGILYKSFGFYLDAYKVVFENPNIPRSYLNTIFYVVVGTSLNILLTSFGAYGLSRPNVLFRNAIMVMIVFTMFFQGGLIANYLLVSKLGLLDTRWSLILPSAISTWNLIIMMTAFRAVPVSLEESARLDGANDFTILFRIVLPLSLPVIAVITLFYAVYHWNSYFNAMIYLRSRELFPLQLILREILITNSTESMTTGVGVLDEMPFAETVKYATIIVATGPILLLYPFLQRYFVKGVMIGALKE
jgi:putative aldouronate transport system permease protein